MCQDYMFDFTGHLRTGHSCHHSCQDAMRVPLDPPNHNKKHFKKNIKNMGAATALGVRAILGERNLSNHFKARVSNEGLSTRWFVCRNILKAYYLKPEILHAPRCGRNTRFQNAAHAIERRTTRSAHVSSILRLKMLAFVPFLFDAVWIKSGAKCPSVSEAKRRYGTKRM